MNKYLSIEKARLLTKQLRAIGYDAKIKPMGYESEPSGFVVSVKIPYTGMYKTKAWFSAFNGLVKNAKNFFVDDLTGYSETVWIYEK